MTPKNFGCDMGVARLNHDVIKVSLFRLLGYNNDSIYATKFPYLTLENHKARESQALQCLRFLCSDRCVLETKPLPYNTCIFFLKSIMATSRSFFDSENEFDRLNSYIFGLGEFSR